MDSLPINAVDLVVLAMLGLSGLLAFLRGFVKEFVSLLSWVGGAFAAYLYLFNGPASVNWGHVSKLSLMDAGIGVAIFVGGVILIGLLGRAVLSLVPTTGFTALDRSAGLLYGLLRGAFVICLLYLIVATFVPRQDHPDWMRQARSLPLIERGSAFLLDLWPEVTEKAEKAERLSEDLMNGLRKDRDGGAGGSPDGETGYGADERAGFEELLEGSQE